MKFYCLGNPIALIKLAYSTNFLANLPVIGVPILGKLPMTEAKMLSAYEESKTLTLCKTLEDANALRHAKIEIGNTNVTPELYRGGIAQGYPLHDFAIYEIEIDDGLEINFRKLLETTDDGLEKMVKSHLQFMSIVAKDRSGIPDIEICTANKSDINPKLIACHYLSLADGHEEKPERSLFNLE